MSIKRQSAMYIGIGLLQFLLDWAVMVLLSNAGMRVDLSNICGRIAGALLGFVLNGIWTFKGEHNHVGRKQLLRFFVMWLLTTIGSTVVIHQIDVYEGLRVAQWSKPLVEFVFGIIGFITSRHWVYRK